MIRADRRAVVVGLAATVWAGRARAVAPQADRRLRAALDALPSNDPVVALGLLSGFDPAQMSVSGRIDLLTVREGLAIDAELARRLPTAPGGDAEGYALLLRRRLGAGWTTAAARRRLAAAHADLSRRADALLRRLGQTHGSVGERIADRFADPRYHYDNDESGRDRAVADMNRSLDANSAWVARTFTSVPAWCLNVSAARTSRSDEIAGRSGRRELPTPARAGTYSVDLNDIGRRPSWSLTSVVAHELLPGHMIQLPIEAAADPHPLRLRYTPAFAEGWAIYAEQFAFDAAGVARTPLDRLGQFHWLLFRTGRGLIDLAIHLDGWSLARARAQLEAWQGVPAYFAPFDTDLARIAAEPASRATEALAWLAIRDGAPADAGQRATYHARLLAGGRKRLLASA